MFSVRSSSTRHGFALLAPTFFLLVMCGGCRDEQKAQTPQQAAAEAKRLLDQARTLNTDERLPALASQLVALGEPGLEACSQALGHTYSRTGKLAAMALAQAGEPGQDLLIAAVASGGSLARARAIAALEANPSPKATEVLIARLQHPPPFQASLHRAIVKIGQPAVPGLIAALTDSAPRRQAAVANLLGQLGDPAAVEPLAELIGHKDYRVRLNVTEALAQFGDRTVDIVTPKLRGGAKVRAHAIKVLAATGTPKAAELLVACFAEGKYNPGLDGTISSMGSVAVKPLIAQIDRERARSTKAWKLGRALARIDDPQVVAAILRRGDKLRGLAEHALDMLASKPELVERPALEILVNTEETPQARTHATYVLGKAKSKAAVEPLLKILAEAPASDDPLGRLKKEAIRALGNIGDKRAMEPLLALLDKPGYGYLAVMALGNLGAPEATDGLIRMLQAKPSPDQRLIIMALGKLKAREAVPAIRAACSQYPSNSQIGEAAAIALESIGGDAAFDALGDLIASKRIMVRATALHAAVTINPTKAMLHIERLAGDKAWAVQMTRVWACRKMDRPTGIKLAQQIIAESPAPDVRRSSIEYLAECGPDVASFLRQRFKVETDLSVRKAIVKALHQLKDASAMPIFIEAATEPQTRSAALDAIAAMGDESAAPLLQEYKDLAQTERNKNDNSHTIMSFVIARDALSRLQRRLAKQATSQPK